MKPIQTSLSRALQIVILLGTLLAPACAWAQWQGTLTYDIQVQMDASMASMPEFAKNMILANVPTQMVISLASSGNSHVDVNTAKGKMMEVITDGSNGNSHMLDRTARKAYLVKPEDSPQAKSPGIVKSGETAVIVGYTCTKYVITPVEKKYNPQTVWVAHDLSLPKGVNISAGGNPYDYTRLGITGVPLKIQYSGTGVQNMTMTATSIKTSAPNANLFGVPAGFTVEPFSSGAYFRNMMRSGK